MTFFLLSRDFFRAVSPGGIPKPSLTYNFFWPQTANAVKYSICNPLEASGLAFDEARSSSSAHPSQSCSLPSNQWRHSHVTDKVPSTVLLGLRVLVPSTLLLVLGVLQHSTPFRAFILGTRMAQGTARLEVGCSGLWNTAHWQWQLVAS